MEYKFLSGGKIPVRSLVDLTTKQRYLSALQVDWLDGRLKDGRNVWVIVGCKEGGVIYRSGMWHNQMHPDDFRALLIDRKTLAAQILDTTGQHR